MTQDVLTRGLTATDADAARVSQEHGEPPWLAAQREDAWRTYERMDLPDPGDEEWRRTDVRAVSLEGLSVHAAPSSLGAEALNGHGGRIVQREGEVVSALLSDAAREAGVLLSDLHIAAREHEAIFRKYFGTVVPASEWKYVALNASLWSGGCFVYVPDNVELELPVSYVQELASPDVALFPRVLIVTGRNSRLAFIDEQRSVGGAARAVVSAATEIVVGDGSTVEYYALNDWGSEVSCFSTVRAVLGRDAQFTAFAAGIGGKLTKMRLEANMPLPGARSDLLGVTFGSDSQHFDYNTRQDHIGPHTVSDLQFKAALTDSASLAWYGVTRIHPTAGGSEANQTSRNMLLSEHAKAAPIPVLEIEAHDVSKCSHGATAGPVDEEELFYLEARAIPHTIAQSMLVEGFFADVVDRVPDARVRDRVMDAVLRKLGAESSGITYDELLSA